MHEIEFIISGEPVPKQRPRWAGRGRKPRTPKKTKTAEKHVASAGLMCRYSGWPMSADARYELEVIAIHKDRRICDLDNALKLVSDALNGVLYPDDKQLFSVSASRKFGDEPRTVVRVRAMGAADD